MSPTTARSVTPAMLLGLLAKHRRMWIVPMIGMALLAGIASFVLPRNWKATQGLLVRPEAADVSKLGQFADLTEMKTLQQTLLELARSNTVVMKVLKEVGPVSTWTSSEAWPTKEDVEEFREAMVMTPPNGAEFGKTEIFYLSVLNEDPKRAIALVKSLSQLLEQRAKEYRSDRAQSVIQELQHNLAMAEQQLDARIAELKVIEQDAGVHLNDLRNVASPFGGITSAEQNLLAIRSELRQHDNVQQRSHQLLEVLQGAQQDPVQLIAAPSSLLTDQPELRRLKDGLANAQLRTARLRGQFSDKHPYVLVAQEAEQRISQELQKMAVTATAGVQLELALTQRRMQGLEDRLEQWQTKTEQLAASRAEYAKLAATVDNHTQLVDTARTNLADAKQRLTGSSTSLLSRIDDVESSLRPVGPGRATVTAAGGLFGMIFGIGLVFVLYGPLPYSNHELDAVEQRELAPRSPLHSAPRATDVAQAEWNARPMDLARETGITDTVSIDTGCWGEVEVPAMVEESLPEPPLPQDKVAARRERKERKNWRERAQQRRHAAETASTPLRSVAKTGLFPLPVAEEQPVGQEYEPPVSH